MVPHRAGQLTLTCSPRPVTTPPPSLVTLVTTAPPSQQPHPNGAPPLAARNLPQDNSTVSTHLLAAFHRPASSGEPARHGLISQQSGPLHLQIAIFNASCFFNERAQNQRKLKLLLETVTSRTWPSSCARRP